jgi:hypothetical protein
LRPSKADRTLRPSGAGQALQMTLRYMIVHDPVWWNRSRRRNMFRTYTPMSLGIAAGCSPCDRTMLGRPRRVQLFLVRQDHTGTGL